MHTQITIKSNNALDRENLKNLKEQKQNLELWFYDFPESPNEPEMRHLYGLILTDIEEIENKIGIYEEPY